MLSPYTTIRLGSSGGATVVAPTSRYAPARGMASTWSAHGQHMVSNGSRTCVKGHTCLPHTPDQIFALYAALLHVRLQRQGTPCTVGLTGVYYSKDRGKSSSTPLTAPDVYINYYNRDHCIKDKGGKARQGRPRRTCNDEVGTGRGTPKPAVLLLTRCVPSNPQAYIKNKLNKGLN